jgi:hypothetical protein
MRLTTPRTAAALVLAIGLVAACTPVSDQPSAEQALCDSLAAFADSVQAITDLDPATDSVEDMQAAADTAQEQWAAVETAAAEVGEADEAAVEAAWTDLAQQIDDFSTDVPVSDALAEVEAGADEVQGAYEEMANGLGCEGAPASSPS